MAEVSASSNLVLQPIDLFSKFSIICFWVHKKMKRGSSIMNLKTIKQAQKKSPAELQEYLHFKRRGSITRAKKGKGSFSRKPKYKNLLENS